jgi:hypothetical protein
MLSVNGGFAAVLRGVGLKKACTDQDMRHTVP